MLLQYIILTVIQLNRSDLGLNYSPSTLTTHKVAHTQVFCCSNDLELFVHFFLDISESESDLVKSSRPLRRTLGMELFSMLHNPQEWKSHRLITYYDLSTVETPFLRITYYMLLSTPMTSHYVDSASRRDVTVGTSWFKVPKGFPRMMNLYRVCSASFTYFRANNTCAENTERNEEHPK